MEQGNKKSRDVIEKMKSLSLIINITYYMFCLIIAIINYLQKKGEDQEMVGIIMSS